LRSLRRNEGARSKPRPQRTARFSKRSAARDYDVRRPDQDRGNL
jgi:hypothetical protein